MQVIYSVFCDAINRA
jgi:hypothetical protein